MDAYGTGTKVITWINDDDNNIFDDIHDDDWHLFQVF